MVFFESGPKSEKKVDAESEATAEESVPVASGSNLGVGQGTGGPVRQFSGNSKMESGIGLPKTLTIR